MPRAAHTAQVLLPGRPVSTRGTGGWIATCPSREEGAGRRVYTVGGSGASEQMRCLICKSADTRPGTTTVTLERYGLTMVVKDVPARMCPNCGEAYVDEVVAVDLLSTAGQVAAAGAEVDVRSYVAATP